MEAFWNKLSCSFVALFVLVVAWGLALNGCDRQPTPNPSDEVFCVYADEPSETGETERFCCREFAVDPSVDCWRETR